MALRRAAESRAPQDPADPGGVRLAALALLARRDFAAAELHARLLERGFDALAVSAEIDGLKAAGTVDDARYAHNYVAYHAGRGQGPVRIAAELKRHGVTPALVEQALKNGPDWRALAAKVCRAKFGPQPAASWGEKARQARFLQYRGFSADHIRAATGTDPETGPTDL